MVASSVCYGPLEGRITNGGYLVNIHKYETLYSNNKPVLFRLEVSFHSYNPFATNPGLLTHIKLKDRIFNNCVFIAEEKNNRYILTAERLKFTSEVKKNPSEENLEELNKQIKEKYEEVSEIAPSVTTTVTNIEEKMAGYGETNYKTVIFDYEPGTIVSYLLEEEKIKKEKRTVEDLLVDLIDIELENG